MESSASWTPGGFINSVRRGAEVVERPRRRRGPNGAARRETRFDCPGSAGDSTLSVENGGGGKKNLLVPEDCRPKTASG